MRNESRQTDRRVIRTKKEILNALTELLEKKSIDEITVKEITDLAGINRGTFYLHYVDKYDLLEKSVNQIIMEMREIGKVILVKAAGEDDPDAVKEEVIESVAALFQYVKDNHRLVSSLMSENSTYSFHHKFNEILKDYFVEKVHRTNLKVPPVYLVSAVTFAYEGIFHTWLKGNMKESPKQMGEIGFEIIYRNLAGNMNGRTHRH